MYICMARCASIQRSRPCVCVFGCLHLPCLYVCNSTSLSVPAACFLSPSFPLSPPPHFASPPPPPPSHTQHHSAVPAYRCGAPWRSARSSPPPQPPRRSTTHLRLTLHACSRTLRLQVTSLPRTTPLDRTSKPQKRKRATRACVRAAGEFNEDL